MADNASPDNVVSNADPKAIKADEIHGLSTSRVEEPETTTIDSSDPLPNGHGTSVTNGHATTPVRNGEAQHGHGDHEDLIQDERPSKRRRTRDATPPNSIRKPKLESPP